MITPCLHTEFHAAYLHRVPAAAVVYFWREGIPEDGKMRLPIPDTTDPPTSDLIAGTRYSYYLWTVLSPLRTRVFSSTGSPEVDLVATNCHVSLIAQSARGTGAGLIACTTATAAAFVSMGIAFAATTDD